MPFLLRENTLAIYSPKNYIILKADPVTIDTEIAVNLPEHSTLFVTTKFKGQEIKVVRGPVQKKRLRLTLLNTSYFHTHIVDKNSIVGYVLSPNSKLIIRKHAKKKKIKLPKGYVPRTWNWKKYWQQT